jgi:endonuclease G
MRFIDSNDNKIRSRLNETQDERIHSFTAINSGRPLAAENDETRKRNRISEVAHVSNELADKIAQYDQEAVNSLSFESRFGAERIQGKTVDFIHVSFFEFAKAAAYPVARVIFRDFTPQGTGFMISDQLFITNNHVIENGIEAKKFIIEFDYELDATGKPKPTAKFELAPDVFFISSGKYELDYTIVAVGKSLWEERNVAKFGYIPLSGADDKHSLGEFANIIQHPMGGFKQVVIRQNQLVARNGTVLHYFSDTQNGSSGSPVFNDQWEVIAIHHWGGPTEFANPINGQQVTKEVNEGIRISAIVKDLRLKIGELSPEKQELLYKILHTPSSQPSLADKESTFYIQYRVMK